MIEKKLKNKLPKDIIPVADFHWGLDPGILITARMCQMAMRKMNFKKGDRNIYICSDMYRCHVDSVQVYTGCTLSSGRLSVRDFGKNAIIVFDKKKNVAKRFFLKAGFPDIFKEFIPNIPKPRLGEIMQKIAFSVINYKPQDLISFEEIKISPKFRKFMERTGIIEIKNNYFEILSRENPTKYKKTIFSKDERKRLKKFIERKISRQEESLLFALKKNYGKQLLKKNRFDIYAVSEGKTRLADAVQALWGLTYGNKHLMVAEKTKTGAIAVFNYSKKEGVRFYLKDEKVLEEKIKIKINFIPNYPAVIRRYCQKCNELIFDGREEQTRPKRICSECARDCFKKMSKL